MLDNRDCPCCGKQSEYLSGFRCGEDDDYATMKILNCMSCNESFEIKVTGQDHLPVDTGFCKSIG